MRAISHTDGAVIKTATVASIEALDGVSRAARELGIASSTLTKYASPADEWRESFVRLDIAVAMDRRSGHPFLLDAMTKLVSSEPVKSFGDLTAAAILRLDGVLDDVVREVVRAIEDDHIDAAERIEVCDRIVAAQTVLARLFAHMVGVG